MAGILATASLNDFVKNAEVMWREGYDRVPLVARSLYDVRTTSNKTSEHSQVDGFSFAERKDEGGNYAIGNINQGYTLNLSQQRIGIMKAITWEMRKYDKYREIQRVLQNLGMAASHRMELDLTHQFTFGMSASSYTNRNGETVSTTTADGQNIFDTDHTITGGSGTYSNLITTEFSKDGLEDAETQFTTFVDNSGNKVVVMPDTIVTTDHPALVNNVKEFIKSTSQPDTANNAVNVYSGKYKHVVLPYLATDKNGARNSSIVNYWMLADTSHTDAICEISEEPHLVSPNGGGNGEDFMTDDWYFKTSAAYDYGVLDYKWIVGSTGATS